MHSGLDRIVSSSEDSFAYDVAGNLKNMVYNGKSMVFSFDDEGRLQSNDTLGVQYVADGDGNVVVRRSGAIEQGFVIDPLSEGWQPLYQFDSTGRDRYFVWEGNHPLASFSDVERPEYYLVDHLGTPRVVTNEDGQEVSRVRNLVFGGETGPVAPDALEPGFAGMILDSRSGIYLSRRRSYAAHYGRYLQPEPEFRVPSGNQADMSVYAYAGNDPVNLHDRSGGGSGVVLMGPGGGLPFASVAGPAFAPSMSINLPPLTPMSALQGELGDPFLPIRIPAPDFAAPLQFDPTAPSPLTIGPPHGDLTTPDFPPADSPTEAGGGRSPPSRIGGWPDWSPPMPIDVWPDRNPPMPIDVWPDSNPPTPIDVWPEFSPPFAGPSIGPPGASDGWPLRGPHGEYPKTSPSFRAPQPHARPIGAVLPTFAKKNDGSDKPKPGDSEVPKQKPAKPSRGGVFGPGWFRDFVDGPWGKALDWLGGLLGGLGGADSDPPGRDGSDPSPGPGQPKPPKPVIGPNEPTTWPPGVKPVPGAGPISPGTGRPGPRPPARPRPNTPGPRTGLHARSNSNVGGVTFEGAQLPVFENPVGIGVDDSGRLFLIDEKNSTVSSSPVSIDEIAVIFQAIYTHGVAPYVSIDPNPQDPNGDHLVVRHDLATKNTFVGWVLFEADRLMKSYSLGEDNLSRKPVRTSVPSYPDLLTFDDDQPEDEDLWNRFWIAPSSVSRHDSSERTFATFEISMMVDTEVMEFDGAHLVPATSASESAYAGAFSTWFTKHYSAIAQETETDEFAEIPNAEFSVLDRLKKLAFVAAAALYLRDKGQPLPLCISQHRAMPYETPSTTPALTVSRT